MTETEENFDPEAMAQMVRQAIPHVKELGAELVHIERGRATMSLAYQERLIGNPETGVVHGGVITTLIDTVCGMSVFTRMAKIGPIATLDLRIDYLKPATPGADLLAEAECYKVTRNVAFVRGLAYHEDRDDPIANCAGTFMVGTPGASMLSKTGKAR
jgi:uncharacterized protein (TIGR00369 family)